MEEAKWHDVDADNALVWTEIADQTGSIKGVGHCSIRYYQLNKPDASGL